jgi:hypothetical protein
MDILSSFLSIRSSLVDTTAADSSIRGIVTNLIGASLDFPITNEHFVLPELSAILM